MYLYIQNFPSHFIKDSAGYALRQNIRFHSLPLAELQLNLAILNPVRDEEVLYVEMPGALGGRVALLRKGDRAGVVVQDPGGTYLVSQLDQEVAGPDNAS